MKIVNIDAPKYLVESVIKLDVRQFVLDNLRHLEKTWFEHRNGCLQHARDSFKILPTEPIWKFEVHCYENVFVLVHTIPIYLRNSNPREIEKKGILDLLGSYHKSQRGKCPYVEMYLTEIVKYSGMNDQQFKWLFTMTLIHELAHATMDIFNWSGFNFRKKEKISYNTEFGKWREESMANAVALRIIRDSGNDEFYNYARQFASSQPQEYALGIKMVDFDYWDFCNVIDSKEEGVNIGLQKKWLKYVAKNPSWKGLHRWNHILSCDCVYLYNGHFYQEYQLIPKIVNDVLFNYEKDYGAKMSVNEFDIIFPYIKTISQRNNNHQTKIELLEGSYAIQYSWNAIQMLSANLGNKYKFKEYRNHV